ncbi:MAG TPA: Ldh family oxidoreductase [Burkholderiales bacterium]|nr:Ldh family oxidoreductase [Burkholderiales bacterium]
MTGSLTVTADALKSFVRAVFERAGMSAEHATTVAEVIVWANLRGVDSHGVTRVPRYVEWIGAGVVNPRPAFKVITETAASVLIEADRAAGPVAMTAAMDAAVRKAREAGAGLALVRATTHTAALGYYTQAAARQGMAALALAGSIPIMAYHGAAAAGVSTSPISIAVPGGSGGPIVLDMATSIVSLGRLAQARRAGQPIPEGWALDGAGKPTTDPQRAEIPLPMGGPKGSGLALMVELLTSVLVGNPILAGTVGRPGRARHRQNGFALAIDVSRYGDPAVFAREVEQLVAALKVLPAAAGVDILVPGERGARTYEQRSREGIPVPAAIRDELNAAARLVGAPLL